MKKIPTEWNIWEQRVKDAGRYILEWLDALIIMEPVDISQELTQVKTEFRGDFEGVLYSPAEMEILVNHISAKLDHLMKKRQGYDFYWNAIFGELHFLRALARDPGLSNAEYLTEADGSRFEYVVQFGSFLHADGSQECYLYNDTFYWLPAGSLSKQFMKSLN